MSDSNSTKNTSNTGNFETLLKLAEFFKNVKDFSGFSFESLDFSLSSILNRALSFLKNTVDFIEDNLINPLVDYIEKLGEKASELMSIFSELAGLSQEIKAKFTEFKNIVTGGINLFSSSSNQAEQSEEIRGPAVEAQNEENSEQSFQDKFNHIGQKFKDVFFSNSSLEEETGKPKLGKK